MAWMLVAFAALREMANHDTRTLTALFASALTTVRARWGVTS
jgi:hypothetical protein